MIKVFGHKHPLDLIDLQPNYPNYEEEYSDDDDEDNDLIVKQDFQSQCFRCGEEINRFHRYYYKCSDSCNYSFHKFCVELPATLNHASHQAHTLILIQREIRWQCDICHRHRHPQERSYNCSACDFDIDVTCFRALEEKFYHPSHPHPLVLTSRPILCVCDACGEEHKGRFYQCTTCSEFYIHRDCAFLPKQLMIQQTTKHAFSHTHPLTLFYSFPEADQEAKFHPRCRICGFNFYDNENLWIYKCEKCWYFAHLNCATSRKESFMSIFSSTRTGKIHKDFEDIDHPNLLHLPFPDQTYNILKHLFFEKTRSESFKVDEGNLKHVSHQHPLRRVETPCYDITRPTSSRINSLSCHNPMKKIELLCNGCIRPITTVPFYKCNNDDLRCNFVLHEWCTRLPAEVQNHPGHPQHALVLLPNIPCKFFGVYDCDVCRLPCNGFSYSCVPCDYHIDVNCGFIPEKITHEAHPGHLLWRVQTRLHNTKGCAACVGYYDDPKLFLFSCRTCDFNLHHECALLQPQTIRHKYDKHPMNLSYFPIENHKSQYFCEICETEFDPGCWFYHCKKCGQSIHSACAPLILECERAVYNVYDRHVYQFMNIKFGGIYNLKDHEHPLSFVQGIKSDGKCAAGCDWKLKYQMIFKCLDCKFAIDLDCCNRVSNQ